MADRLSNSLNEAIANIIKGGGISNGSTETITPQGEGAHILALSRVGSDRHVVVMTDYWASTYYTVSGSVPSGITISKSANSHSITVTNTTGSAIAYMYI